ncbi:ATP-binding protein [Polaromonas sp.]|uniref:ATP-binding protein n=1 Tax=Polaromonas sp. TaxID=1869339 RepID=UPI0032678525
MRDFGSRVAPSQLTRLTEPFYRTDSARQRATGGVDLGMYLCRLIAQAHGSELELRNTEPGLGVRLRYIALSKKQTGDGVAGCGKRFGRSMTVRRI